MGPAAPISLAFLTLFALLFCLFFICLFVCLWVYQIFFCFLCFFTCFVYRYLHEHVDRKSKEDHAWWQQQQQKHWQKYNSNTRRNVISFFGFGILVDVAKQTRTGIYIERFHSNNNQSIVIRLCPSRLGTTNATVITGLVQQVCHCVCRVSTGRRRLRAESCTDALLTICNTQSGPSSILVCPLKVRCQDCVSWLWCCWLAC